MKNSSANFEKAVADFQYNGAAARIHRDALDRGNAQRIEVRARFRDWPVVRAAAAAIRDADVRQMEKRLTDFAARFEGAGGKLHWAPSAEEARTALLAIANQAGVKTVVSGHSSTLEEIEAGAVLEKAGVKVRRTEFGDLITGLRNETPSHFASPAMHLSREQVGKTLHDGLGTPTTLIPEEQADLVRQNLREDFLTADMGLVGANFLVADEGKVVLVDREGNLRLIAALPRVLVVVAGIDKVTGEVDDLPLLLQALAASACGQLTPPGITILGPDAKRACGAATEMHVILVDNGRTVLLADPASSETLRCVKCGACADVCPVYRMAGGHAYGSPIPGPIGAVLTPNLMPKLKQNDLALASPLCGACGDVCPVGIDLHRALVSQRRTLSHKSIGWRLRMMLRLYTKAMSSPGHYAMSVRMARILVTVADLTRGTPFNPLADWAKHRNLPDSPGKTFRSWWKATGGSASSAARKN